MARSMRIRLDFYVYEDSEQWLYNELLHKSDRGRSRYCKNILRNYRGPSDNSVKAAAAPAAEISTPLPPPEEQDLLARLSTSLIDQQVERYGSGPPPSAAV
jgi:hypothetical protein